MIDYLNNERLLDLLENGITEMLNGQEINVVLDGKEIGHEIVRQMIKKWGNAGSPYRTIRAIFRAGQAVAGEENR